MGSSTDDSGTEKHQKMSSFSRTFVDVRFASGSWNRFVRLHFTCHVCASDPCEWLSTRSRPNSYTTSEVPSKFNHVTVLSAKTHFIVFSFEPQCIWLSSQDYWFCRLCALSCILKKRTLRKLHLFPSSGEEVGDVYSTGSVRRNYPQSRDPVSKLINAPCPNSHCSRSKPSGSIRVRG
jgi:hypothetical protein